MFPPYYYIGQGPQTARDRIAILGLEVAGAVDLKSVRVARELTTALRLRAANGPYAIAPNSDRELIDQKVMHNCPDDRKECMTKIGRALNTEHLLYGRIARSARWKSQASIDGYQISLQLLDVNSGHLTSWADFIPVAESTGTKLAARGRIGYEHLIAGIRPRRESRAVADDVLTHATNETFWKLTRYKPGQKLDMSNSQDRAMSKTWLDIYAQIKGRRDRATNLAKRILNETVTPYILIIEQRNGSLTHQVFPRWTNLDVQYSWLLDQPDYYTYIAAFDFTKNRDAPLYDQFALMRRSQVASSGWYDGPTGIAGWG